MTYFTAQRAPSDKKRKPPRPRREVAYPSK
jgi:hypothetical protein